MSQMKSITSESDLSVRLGSFSTMCPVSGDVIVALGYDTFLNSLTSESDLSVCLGPVSAMCLFLGTSQWHSGEMGQVLFCGLIKGISPNICILCVRVKINKRSFKPFCAWITSGGFSVSVFVFLNDVSVSGDVALGTQCPSRSLI